MFLAHLSRALIFSGDGEGEVTGVAGDGDGNAEDAGEGGQDLKGCIFVLFIKKRLYLH